jgi:hypothetical protein
MRRWQLGNPLLVLGFAGTVGLGGCVDTADLAGPFSERWQLANVSLPQPGARGISVLTRNLYLGADINPVLAAPPAQIPIVVAQTWAHIQATNFPSRAGALADEIGRVSPHVVGLQEVALFLVQPNGDAAFGGNTPATQVALDFLTVLLNQLAARGLDYQVVSLIQNADVELPMFTGGSPNPFTDLRFIDRDVILARSDVAIQNAAAGNYAAFVPLPVGPALRGWTAVDATVNGTAFRFINTHLEVQSFAPVQAAQAQQLLAMANASPLPVVLVGDLNSAADNSQTPTYATITQAGYDDVWVRAHRMDPGYTCCHAKDLLNPTPTLDQRLDLVLIRGFGPSPAHGAGSYHAEIVGENAADRTASGLWPSDHAGVAAILRVPAAGN